MVFITVSRRSDVYLFTYLWLLPQHTHTQQRKSQEAKDGSSLSPNNYNNACSQLGFNRYLLNETWHHQRALLLLRSVVYKHISSALGGKLLKKWINQWMMKVLSLKRLWRFRFMHVNACWVRQPSVCSNSYLCVWCRHSIFRGYNLYDNLCWFGSGGCKREAAPSVHLNIEKERGPRVAGGSPEDSRGTRAPDELTPPQSSLWVAIKWHNISISNHSSHRAAVGAHWLRGINTAHEPFSGRTHGAQWGNRKPGSSRLGVPLLSLCFFSCTSSQTALPGKYGIGLLAETSLFSQWLSSLKLWWQLFQPENETTDL